MHTIASPIGTQISIPEAASENERTFLLDELDSAREHYFEHGYAVLRAAVSPDVCDAIRRAFDQTVKRYPGYIYRQTTQNPEKNKFSEYGFVMNPILNVQSLNQAEFGPLRSLAMKVFASDAIKRTMNKVFGEEGKLVQSMYFEGNSETWPHQDTYYLDSESIGTMAACWFALEDIDAGAGRFFVLPDTHRIDMARNGKNFDVAFNHDRYKALVKKIIVDNELEIRAPFLQKGDVLFWNAKLIHGSLRSTRPQFSRSSLTAHYIPASHRFLQFQSRIKALKLRNYAGMDFHCPKSMDEFSNRFVMRVETTFPKAFQTVKKLAIKALVR
jgi:phytanoyl-CoA hydroxylase